VSNTSNICNKELIESRVYKDPFSGCWNWTRGKDKDGYGKIKVEGRSLRAHRVSYQVFKGEFPENLQTLHSCDNPSCCNPDHLWVGSNADNMADRDNKGRTARGERNGGGGKLKEEEVRLILSDTRRTGLVAEDFGVSIALVYKIRTGEVWKHIDPETGSKTCE